MWDYLERDVKEAITYLFAGFVDVEHVAGYSPKLIDQLGSCYHNGPTQRFWYFESMTLVLC